MASIDFPNSPAVNDVFTAGNSSYRWTGAAWVSNNLAAITWESLAGKPTTFPPSTHTHVVADTTGLQTALDGKAATSHTHVVADTTGLQTALDGKAATSHTHVVADTTGLQTALDGKAATSHTHVKANITDFAHTHLLADITDYTAPDLSGKQDVVAGVSSTEIGYLDGVTSAIQTQLNGKASTSHTHAISDTTGLQTALDGKVDEVNGAVTTASTSLTVVRNITLSTSAPTGGADGDVWLVYTP